MMEHGYPLAGPHQNPSSTEAYQRIFFTTDAEVKEIFETKKHTFDYIVIGSSFCSLAFISETLKLKNDARILILEKGGMFLPEHFQNLPPAFREVLPNQIQLTETFPWSLSSKLHNRSDNFATWSHGAVPFFGGRSVVWSAWCPTPLNKLGELRAWPEWVINMMESPDFFEKARDLIKVKSSNSFTSGENVPYAEMQKEMLKRYESMIKHNLIPGANRCEAAPLACEDDDDTGFAKFSTVNSLLSLSMSHAVKIIAKCEVSRIISDENNDAVALETSQGLISLNGAKVIVAIGCMPAATLMLNSLDPSIPTEIGDTYGSHFITSIVARVHKQDITNKQLKDLELGAVYLAGTASNELSWHLQLSLLYDTDPDKHFKKALRFMPDVVATASRKQMKTSKEYIVIVIAALGEMSTKGKTFRKSTRDYCGRTTNCTIDYDLNEDDLLCWDEMDIAAIASTKNLSKNVQYWHMDGNWKDTVPDVSEYRVSGTVHESCIMPFDKVVDETFQVKQGIKNVFITGSSMWPTAGSWNPTLTMVGFAQELARQQHLKSAINPFQSVGGSEFDDKTCEDFL